MKKTQETAPLSISILEEFFSRSMRSNQGEFLQFILAFLVLFLHRIPVFGTALEIDHCDRTCGSTTVQYPFGFSSACPYMLDRNCSKNEDVYLKGFQVLDFTTTSIIIQSRQLQSLNNKSICSKVEDIFTKFNPQFSLTSRNLLLFSGNCSNVDFHFNVTDLDLNITELRNGPKHFDGIENCSKNISGSITSLMPPNNNTEWFTIRKSLETSTCKYFLSILLSHNATYNRTTSLDADQLELSWWVNGPCIPDSCSANAYCSDFKNPNNNNEMVHRCYCTRMDFQ